MTNLMPGDEPLLKQNEQLTQTLNAQTKELQEMRRQMRILSLERDALKKDLTMTKLSLSEFESSLRSLLAESAAKNKLLEIDPGRRSILVSAVWDIEYQPNLVLLDEEGTPETDANGNRRTAHALLANGRVVLTGSETQVRLAHARLIKAVIDAQEVQAT